MEYLTCPDQPNFYRREGILRFQLHPVWSEISDLSLLTDDLWEHSLKFILNAPPEQDRDVAALLRNEHWIKWATDPARIYDPADDPVAAIGLSKWWAALKSRFRWIGYWHDLMYRRLTSQFYSRAVVDNRFLELCLLPEFSHGWDDRAVARFYYGVVRLVGGKKYDGPK